jgi:hypothetical protein
MSISIFVSKSKLSNLTVSKLLDDLTSDNPEFVRVPGVSKSGICDYCSQFIYMVHDGSGSEVPLPVTGTHFSCVCQDTPLAIFKLGTKASLADTFEIPTDYKYPIRRAKAGKVERFEWLKKQNKKTLRHILGVTRAGYLSEMSLEDFYDADGKLIPLKEL